LFRGLTVEQNILIVVEAYEVDRARRARLASNLIECFRLEHVRNALAAKISGGERRRCEIARTLAARPSFILFDEPFAGIDPIAISEIRAVIRSLAQRGFGILITDHNVKETLDSVDRAYVINAGRILFSGSPEEITRSPRVRSLYFERPT